MLLTFFAYCTFLTVVSLQPVEEGYVWFATYRQQDNTSGLESVQESGNGTNLQDVISKLDGQVSELKKMYRLFSTRARAEQRGEFQGQDSQNQQQWMLLVKRLLQKQNAIGELLRRTAMQETHQRANLVVIMGGPGCG